MTRRANELYWGSDESVNQIAERLDLSKSGLYGMIGPLNSGLGCPICGAEVEYANRTARDRDELSCPTCTWEGAESEAVPLSQDAADAAYREERGLADGFDQDRTRIMLGSTLVGAAVGFALFKYIRRGD
ncbi:MAG: hypothetical protein WD995_06200 [Gemmatimonadota bacterium]